MSAGYIELSVEGDSTLREMLVGILSQTGFEGFWEDEASLKCYMRKERWSEPLREETERIIRMITRANSSPAPRITVHFTEDQNWNASWEKTIRPIRITDSLLITPSWHEVQSVDGQIVLVIDPKMSFGTGYHETTRLSLRLLERLLRPSMRVLDVGTGTGVLAIAAAKLGATSVTGIDIDEWAFMNAVENVERNSVADRVRIHQTPIGSVTGPAFDLIVANIQLDVIVGLLGDMVSRLTVSGTLILSGLFQADKPALSQILAGHELSIGDELTENEWIAIAARRRTA